MLPVLSGVEHAQDARELDVQYVLGHSTSAMVRRYSATYDAAKAAEAHARFSLAAPLLGGFCQISGHWDKLGEVFPRPLLLGRLHLVDE